MKFEPFEPMIKVPLLKTIFVLKLAMPIFVFHFNGKLLLMGVKGFCAKVAEHRRHSNDSDILIT
jgi:hypothetical protein